MDLIITRELVASAASINSSIGNYKSHQSCSSLRLHKHPELPGSRRASLIQHFSNGVDAADYNLCRGLSPVLSRTSLLNVVMESKVQY